MFIIKSIGFAIAALLGFLLAGLLIIAIPVLIPEARPYYIQAYRLMRASFRPRGTAV